MLHSELTHPEILNLLAQCGHGDSFAVVDSNYPAQARRQRGVPLISLNVTHNLVSTPIITELVSQALPIEKFAIPVPPEESGNEPRPVHAAIRSAVTRSNPEAEITEVAPGEFYGLTSDPHLAFMIVSGERSHYGSVVLTVGYLPET